MTAKEIELILVKHFDFRTNLIVPNVSWGWKLPYEADLVVLRPSGWAEEIEIKVCKGDIKADREKKWSQHWDKHFLKLWFAVPSNLSDCEFIPEHAGILSVHKNEHGHPRVVITRGARRNPVARKVTEKERQKLSELGCMRIWDLKTHISNMKNYSEQKKKGGC